MTTHKTSEALSATPDISTPEAACTFFLPLAVFDPATLSLFRCDPHLAHHNASIGVTVVLAEQARIASELPTVDLELIRTIPNLALAVLFAGSRVNRTPEASELRGLQPQGHILRRKMLSAGTSLAESDLLPEREVSAIRSGKGPLDAADDLIQLAALFRRHASAIQGKHPITTNDITTAEKLGTRMIALLRPSAAPRSSHPTEDLQYWVDARDRLWTLLVRRYEVVRKVGTWLYGNSAANKVPNLQSHAPSRKSVKTPAVPAAPTA